MTTTMHVHLPLNPWMVAVCMTGNPPVPPSPLRMSCRVGREYMFSAEFVVTPLISPSLRFASSVCPVMTGTQQAQTSTCLQSGRSMMREKPEIERRLPRLRWTRSMYKRKGGKSSKPARCAVMVESRKLSLAVTCMGGRF